MKRLQLVLHTGGHTVSKDALATPALPDRTETYTPVPHRMVVDAVLENLSANGHNVIGESYALARDGKRMFGLLQIEKDTADQGFVVGVRNSYDKSFPVGIVAGAAVFVCDNLAFNGAVDVFRKHTKHILGDLSRVMGTAMGRLAGFWTNQQNRVDAYKSAGCVDREAHHLIARMYQDGAISKTMIGDVLTEWHKPRHEDFAPRNVWSLYNAFTEHAKGRLDMLERRSTIAHGILDAAVGLQPA